MRANIIIAITTTMRLILDSASVSVPWNKHIELNYTVQPESIGVKRLNPIQINSRIIP